MLGEGRLAPAQQSTTFHIDWFWSDARALLVTSLRLIFAMAATKSPGRDGDEPQPRSAPILHTTSPLESGEILCRCGWVYWISNFCCGLGWLGRMEIGNPSMIKLTFEVWHLKQVWQGESDIDAIFVLMVWWWRVSAASVTCVEVSISAAGGDGQYRHYRHRFRGYQDSWPGRTRLHQHDQGTQDRGNVGFVR